MKNQNSQKRSLELANKFSTEEGRALFNEMRRAESNLRKTIKNGCLIEVAFLEYEAKINAFYLHLNEYIYRCAYTDGVFDKIESAKTLNKQAKFEGV